MSSHTSCRCIFGCGKQSNFKKVVKGENAIYLVCNDHANKTPDECKQECLK